MRLKKVLSLLLLLVVAITLAACKDDKKPPVNTTEKTNKAPQIIGAKNFSVLLDSETPNLKLGISATDEEDGDLTKFIEVTGTVDTSVDGVYDITYTVEDRDGAKAEVKIKVTVSSLIINGANDVTIIRGTAFDPKKDVTATDKTDGTITDKIEVTGTVNVNTKGTYTLTYKVTNTAGATLEVTRVVTVDVLPPTINFGGNTQLLVSELDAFNLKAGVTAKDADDKDLTNSIVVSGDDDLRKYVLNGRYAVNYTVKDEWNHETTVTRYIFVVSEKIPFADGEYSYRFADSELRHTFFAAAEEYLLKTMYGGVPVYANAGFNIYSSRLQLPIENYIPVMGFGTIFGDMSEDDSTVIMDDGKPGKAGEKTFRSAISDNPTTFQHWKYDDSISSDVITLFLDAPYVYKFNAEKDGYDLVPGMAKDKPQAINPRTLDSGLKVSKEWTFEIKEGLVWTYHSSTDTSSFPTGHEKIDANDFYDTYKMALSKKWFRAISGGGDFITANQAIAGAAEYVANPTEELWANVGIKKVDDKTIKFIFKNDMSEWNVRYWLGSFVMGPINMDLYNVVGDQYGTKPENTAYNGIFKLDYYEAGSVLRYSKNQNYWDKDSYKYTGYTYKVIKEQAVRFKEFQDKKLDATSVPTQEYESVKTNPGLKRVPGATTFRMMINGLGTVAEQKKQFPTSKFTPEPILANHDFKLAMFHALERDVLALDVMKTSQTQAYLFTDAYLVDPATGMPFRNTPQGQNVAKDMIGDTYGYSPTLAKSYWKSAIDKLVADKVYAKNSTIMIDLRIMSGSPATLLGAEYMKGKFEEYFVSTEHNIQVKISITLTAFPDIYYDFMMTGDFDLGIGGISGSTLDAAGFLDVFCDDDRGGFTLNWGIDTDVPEIKITYTKPGETEKITELWSYNALVMALQGTVNVKYGVEVK